MKYTDSPVVKLKIGGDLLTFEQDNGTMHVGTTVWPCSLVLSKWAEKQLRFPSSQALPQIEAEAGNYEGLVNTITGFPALMHMEGKRGIELGSGCGVAGMALALLGLNVWLTDIPAVLPALKRNSKKNIAATALSTAGKQGSKIGKVKLGQLIWGNSKQIQSFRPPFDYVIAADVIYLENTVEPFLSTISDLSSPETVILLGYQVRSAEAHQMFWRLCPERFYVNKVPRSELDPQYAYEEADIYILKKK